MSGLSDRGEAVVDVKEAIKIAKDYVKDVFAEEQVTELRLEETEFDQPSGGWNITLAFSRPWNSPRTRAQEVLENLGAASSLRRSYKVLTVSPDGQIVSMKNRQRAEMADP